MPFHPLLMSVRLGGFYNELSCPIKVLMTPFFMILISSTFCIELITLPLRYLIHEITNIYSDSDESIWVYK